MRKIKEILRLKWAQGLSHRKIAHHCGISRPTVTEYLRRAEQAGLSWPLPDEWDDTRLERTLFPETPKGTALERGLPCWAEVHQEMKKKSVTLFLLWQEYREHWPQGYQYSWFCDHYRHTRSAVLPGYFPYRGFAWRQSGLGAYTLIDKALRTVELACTQWPTQRHGLPQPVITLGTSRADPFAASPAQVHQRLSQPFSTVGSPSK